MSDAQENISADNPPVEKDVEEPQQPADDTERTAELETEPDTTKTKTDNETEAKLATENETETTKDEAGTIAAIGDETETDIATEDHTVGQDEEVSDSPSGKENGVTAPEAGEENPPAEENTSQEAAANVENRPQQMAPPGGENSPGEANQSQLAEPSSLAPQNTTETGENLESTESKQSLPVDGEESGEAILPAEPLAAVAPGGRGAPTPPENRPMRPTPNATPSHERPKSAESEVTLTNTALNMVWSFGLNRNVPVLNLSDGERRLIMYCCAHTGVVYDFVRNKQHLLQGHANAIACSCVSEDKKWLATGDKGEGSMVIIWDTHTNTPVQTIFDPDPNGVVCVSMTPDARYLATLSAGPVQNLAIWDWTVDGDEPVCTAELKPSYGLQNFIHFNPEDIHFVVTNSESQVLFFNWEHGRIEYFAPPLTDQDFNKQVGRYSQSIFQRNSSRALTATSLGNLVVWDTNKPITKLVSSLPSADKKALKIIRLQERGIDVLTTTDRFIVVGDTAGHVKFFDQTLKLVNWYQDFQLGPISSLSFEYVDRFSGQAHDSSKYPPDATIAANQFVIRNFVIGTHNAVYGHVTAEGTEVQVIHKEHDAATHALAAHPTEPWIVVGGYSGLLKVWDYQKKTTIASRQFERGTHIYSCAYDPKGSYLAVGFANGAVRILEPITLDDESSEVFRYSKDTVTHVVFSHDSQYIATADAEYTVTVFKRDLYGDELPYVYLGRYRAHYKLIKDIMFGVQLDSNFPRLLSLGEDRVLVEYDLENSQDSLKVLSSDRIEQSAVPTCMEWYPPITKENFILTASDQYKFKLYNATTKMCRKTLLGPTYGSPLKKLCVIPTKEEVSNSRYLAYITQDKVGLQIFPLTGNPHNSMALIAHPGGVSNLAVSHDGRYLFTVGGADASLHMWYININALEGQASLGGTDLIPFYGLLDGGRQGELFAELEDYFYYAQIRNQGVNTMDTREVNIRIPLSEVPFVMRALGFYPSEQEIDDMLNEVKFSQYVETGQFVEDIDLGEFIKLYINHRPAFGLSTEKLIWAFEKLGLPSEYGSAIDRGDLLDLLQTKGEHMTEIDLAEYLTTLMGFNEEGGTSEQQDFDPTTAGDLLDANLPLQINADLFAKEILGFSMYEEVPAGPGESKIN